MKTSTTIVMFALLAGQAAGQCQLSKIRPDDAGENEQAGYSVAFHAKPVVRAQASCALSWSGLDGVVNLFE